MDNEEYLIDLHERFYEAVKDFPISDLSEEELVFLSVWQLEAGVNGEGFHGYFFNNCDSAYAVVDSLEKIGAKSCAKVTQGAIRFVFGSEPPPADQAKCQDILFAVTQDQDGEDIEEAMEKLERFDEKFLDYPDDLSSLLRAYVDANLERIRVVPKA